LRGYELASVPIPSSTYDSTVVSLGFYSASNLVYWTFPRQINATDFSGHRYQLTKTTNNNWYGKVCVSGDGTKLLVERTDRRRTDLCTVEKHFRIYLLESDGSKERRIIFPE